MKIKILAIAITGIIFTSGVFMAIQKRKSEPEAKINVISVQTETTPQLEIEKETLITTPTPSTVIEVIKAVEGIPEPVIDVVEEKLEPKPSTELKLPEGFEYGIPSENFAPDVTIIIPIDCKHADIVGNVVTCVESWSDYQD